MAAAVRTTARSEAAATGTVGKEAVDSGEIGGGGESGVGGGCKGSCCGEIGGDIGGCSELRVVDN